MSDSSSTVLANRYAIERRLARGGMADIFLANDEVLERLVVIKMLLPQYANDPTFVERFRREATLAAKLNHGSVVAVYDWGSEGETYFMAMEYIVGRSLAEILVDEGSIPLGRALEITADAADGLGFAHEHGMVHRDVKPGNIMLTDSGQVKVADFGIARALDGGENLTQTGNVMGTAAYFSPEQARGEIVDARSDLYSLGVVLFEMITGERPFTGTSPVSVAYKHVGEAPPIPSTVNRELPPAVDVVISTLLAKDPNDRYQTAAALREDLERLRAGHQPVGVPLSAGRPSGGVPAGAGRPPAGPAPVAPPSARGVAAPNPVDGTAATSGPQGGDVTAAMTSALAQPPTSLGAVRRAPESAVDGGAGARHGAKSSGGNAPFILAMVGLGAIAIVLLLIIQSALSGPSDSPSTDIDTEDGSVPEDGGDPADQSDQQEQTPPPTTQAEDTTASSETSSTTAQSTASTETTVETTTGDETTSSSDSTSSSETDTTTDTTTESTTESTDPPTTDPPTAESTTTSTAETDPAPGGGGGP